jgi:hypothetical protein
VLPTLIHATTDKFRLSRNRGLTQEWAFIAGNRVRRVDEIINNVSSCWESCLPIDTYQPSRHSEWLSETIPFFWTLFMVLIFMEYDVSGANSASGFR